MEFGPTCIQIHVCRQGGVRDNCLTETWAQEEIHVSDRELTMDGWEVGSIIPIRLANTSEHLFPN